jgi:quercetin dioxygenase-like cupin family protein
MSEVDRESTMSRRSSAGRFLLATAIATAALVVAPSGSAQTDGNGFVRVARDQIKWLPLAEGVELAVLHGDPAKAGAPYIIQVKFPPYTFSYPHYHPEDRHVTVLKGTWYTGTGETLDVEKAVPLKAGSYMFHPAKAVHWDGAKDEEVIVEIAGVGPAPTILAKPGSRVFFSTRK